MFPVNTDKKINLNAISYNPFKGSRLSMAISTTESQREMWATLEMEENATLSYNESVRVTLKGKLSISALEAAYREVLRRHDSLRAVFSNDGKYFCVTDNFNQKINFIDYSDNLNQEKLLDDYISNQTLIKFDLVTGPAIQMSLVKVSENEHLLFLTAHHIICDGWSLAIVLNELSLIYSSYKKIKASDLKWPEQFFGYAQNEYLNGQNIEDEKYWISKFKGDIPCMDLPIDFERPSFRTYNSKRIDVQVPSDLVKQIKKTGAKNGASYYCTLMAVFEVLLHKILQKDELVVGISAAAQSVSGAESLVGHLVNLLPVRQDINPNESFKDFLKKLKSTMLDAFEHQNYTYGSLLKNLNFEREPGKIPLVNIIFNVDQQYPGQGLEFDGIDASFVSNPRHYENFEIFINATSCGDHLVLECQYNENLFKADTISNWLNQYVEILKIVTQNIDKKIADINLLGLIIPETQENPNLSKPAIVEVLNSENEKQVAAIWEKVLGFGNIPHDANFFAIGGHSLLGIEITSAIYKEFEQRLSLKDIFEAPTIAQLALKLSTNNEKSIIELKKIDIDSETNYSASLNQLQTWYLEQINPETTMHNLPSSIRVKGKLDRNILEKSLNYLINRHGSLRTRFEVVNGSPVQKISSIGSIVYKLEEIKSSESTIQNTLNEIADMSFDLKKAPLFDAKLYKLGKEDFVFYFNVHHIIWDGWCFDIFFEELNIIYSALLEGKDPEFQKSPQVEYVEFSTWNNEYVKSEAIKPQLDYWKNKLTAPLPILELPTDYKRPCELSHAGSAIGFTLDEELAKDVRILAQNLNSSLFNVFLTSFKIALAHYTSIEDIIVGSPVRGRNLPELSDTIGFFVNTLALRSSLNLNESFDKNLQVVSSTSQNAFGNQEIPFQVILNEIDWQRDQSRNPIFQTFFSYQDVSNRDAMLGGHKYNQINVDKASTHSDLDLWIKTSKSKIEGAFEFRIDLFKEESIQKFMETFIHILKLATKNSTESLKKLNLTPENQLEEILFKYNETWTDLSSELPFHKLIEKQAAINPKKTAVTCQNESLTYSELDKKSNAWANKLIASGVRPGDLVGLSTDRSCNMLVSLLAILKTGAGYVPLDPGFPQDRLDYMVDSSGLEVLLVTDELSNRFKQTIKKLSIDELAKNNESSAESPNVESDLDSTCYVIYTSGSTGLPKGVELGHRSVLNFLLSMQKKPGIIKNDKLLAVTTLSFDIAVLELYLPLISGAEVVIATKEEAMNADALRDIIETRKITMMQATPSTWRLLLASGWKEDKNFKLLCGGEAFPKDLAHKLCDQVQSVWNMYGPTETTVWSSCKKLSKKDEAILIGAPIDNTSFYILDENLTPVPFGKIGNIFIGGKGLAKGYRGRDDLTSERFLSSPFRDGEKIYDTGDLGRFHVGAELECLGRNDGQVKVRGHRIELGEIENILSKMTNIKQCVVITREDRPSDIRIAAYVIMDSNTDLDQIKVRMELAKTLPPYMIPSHFVVLKDFPQTLNGKIDKKKLPSPIVQNLEVSEKLHESKLSTTEEELLSIWKNVLGKDSIGVEDNFFDLGGHSLLSVELFSKIDEKFNLNLPLSTLFKCSTIKALSSLIDSKSNIKFNNQYSVLSPVSTKMNLTSSIVPIIENGTGEAVFCFHSVGGNVLNYLALAPYVNGRSFIGVQSQGVDGEAKPLKSISEMARSYINQMRLVQPKGPYFLAGGSMGGMIALEVACQLEKMGEKVEKLIMFDTFGPNFNLEKFGQDERSFFKNLKESILFRGKIFVNKFRTIFIRFVGLPIPHDLRYFDIEMANYKALWGYKASTYSGDLDLIRANKTATGWYSDTNMGWAGVIKGEIRTYEISGSHHDFIESPELGPVFSKALL